MFLRLILVFIGLFIFQVSYSQPEAHWNHIVIPEVNRNINVKCFAEDSEGFIWLGANSGLYRFDGYSLKEIQFGSQLEHVKSVKNILVSGDWLYLILGNLNLIRVHTNTFKFEVLYSSSAIRDGQLSNFDFINENTLIAVNTNDVVIKYNLQSKTYELSNIGDIINAVIQKVTWYNSKAWYCTRSSGLCYLDEKNKLQTSKTESVFPYSGFNAEDLCFLSDSLIAFGGWDNALHFYHIPSKNTSHKIFNDAKSIVFDDDEITCITKINNNELWFGTKLSGVYSYNLKTDKIISLKNESFLGSWVYEIFIDSYNNRWVATDLGINLWVEENQFIQRFSLKTTEVENEEHKILSIATNKNGYLFGNVSGLFYLKNLNDVPQFIPTKYKNSQLEIHSILWDNNKNPILGTNRSLFSIDLTNNHIESALPKYNFGKSKSNSFLPLALVSSRFSNVLSYNSQGHDYLLASAYGYGLLNYDIQTGNADFGIISKDNSYVGYLITSVFIDKQAKIWASCKNSGIYYDLNFSNKLFNKPIYSNKNKSTAYDTIMKFNFQAEKHWMIDDLNGLKNQNVLCFEPISDSTFFVGTDGGGLYFFNPNRKPEFHRILNEIETPSSVFLDSLNRLWIIENGNLMLYNHKTESLIRFDEQNGINEKGIFAPLIRGVDGYVYAPGIACFYRFKPEDYFQNGLLSDIKFTNLKLLGHQPHYQKIIDNYFEIHESQSVFSIYFTSLNYKFSKDIHYQYSFANADNTWIDIGKNGNLTFTQLAPGKYKVLVRAFSRDNIPISKLGFISFTIKPYWYKSWWFKILTFLAFTLIIYVLYKYRIREIMRVQIIRDQIARDLHDDIGSTLGAINISTKAAQSQLTNNNQNRVTEILEEIGSYSRELSDHMADIIWAVNPENDELLSLLKRIQQYAQQLLDKANIELDFYVDDKIKEKQLSMDLRRNIYLIIKEALNNSVKYSNCKSITLSFNKIDNKIQILIIDDGIGFNMLEVNSMNGNGLNSMASRCNEMNATFKLDSAIGKGCTIEITI